jgi:DNA-binding transcriptional MerR regulator
MEQGLPPIPAKRYFTIGEVSELCGVKPYVLRYWEQEFSQLRPMKRRGNRRYYQHHEVLLIRRIRELLYDEGFTISGARNRLLESGVPSRAAARPAGAGAVASPDTLNAAPVPLAASHTPASGQFSASEAPSLHVMLEHLSTRELAALRAALLGIRELLDV